ncbi:MAG: nuclear transport factor 2 family protein [Sphingomonadaceae bacterium]|jgi:hypothetical protein
MSSNPARTVEQAEQARCAAMLANDAGALEALLDPALEFCHATGAVDDKAAFLAKMAAGRIRYVGIDWPESKVTMLGDGAALLTGRMNTDVEVEGTAKALRNRVCTVWRLSVGNWRLLSFQSTPIKD